MSGWIKLHRSFLKWEWYSEANTIRLFIHCILKANHEDAYWKGTQIKRGQFITSFKGISNDTGLTIQNIRTSFKNLELTGEVTRESTSKLTKVTICEYDTYNESDKSTNTPANKQLTNDQQTSNTRLTTNKNEKNYTKNEKEKSDNARTREEFENLVKHLFIKFDAMEEFALFCDYWTSQNQLNDTMRFQEDLYFNPAVKVRSWIDRAQKNRKPKAMTDQEILDDVRKQRGLS